MRPILAEILLIDCGFAFRDPFHLFAKVPFREQMKPRYIKPKTPVNEMPLSDILAEIGDLKLGFNKSDRQGVSSGFADLRERLEMLEQQRDLLKSSAAASASAAAEEPARAENPAAPQ